MPEKKRGKGFAIFVAAGILLSRISGLIRERVFGHYFGNSPELGAFRAAFRIPNSLQNLLGEGVLSASFIPVYARLLEEEDEELAGRVAGAVFTILLAVVGLLVLAGVLLAPLLVDVIAIGFSGEVRDLTVRLVRVLFPGMGLLVLYAWSLGILNSHRRFFLSYVAPVLMNVAMIAAVVTFGFRISRVDLAVALSWGFVAGAILQFGVQIPAVLRHERHLRLGLATTLAPVRTVFRNLGPVVMSRGVVQVSAFIDNMIASALTAVAVSALGFAQTLYMLPISLFGMSVAAAELPEMSRVQGASDERNAVLRDRLASAARQVTFFVLPTSIAFLAIGYELVAILFQTGNFGPDDTRLVWYILAGSAIGLLPITLARIYVSGFHALQQTKTPLYYAIGRVIVGAGAGYLLAFPLRPFVLMVFEVLRLPLPSLANAPLLMGAVGLTIASTLAGSVEFLLLRRGLQRRVGAWDSPLKFTLKVALAAILAAAAAISMSRLLLPQFIEAGTVLHPIAQGAIVSAVFALVYGGAVIALRVEEARSVLRRLLRRR